MGINFYYACPECAGTGIRHYNTRDGEHIENPCANCSGTGTKETNTGMDSTLIQQILTNQATIIANLDYIHGKVTAIWNKVK